MLILKLLTYVTKLSSRKISCQDLEKQVFLMVHHLEGWTWGPRSLLTSAVVHLWMKAALPDYLQVFVIMVKDLTGK
jgi:hypothetical protein